MGPFEPVEGHIRACHALSSGELAMCIAGPVLSKLKRESPIVMIHVLARSDEWRQYCSHDT